jgi:hypothetical protein
MERSSAKEDMEMSWDQWWEEEEAEIEDTDPPGKCCPGRTRNTPLSDVVTPGRTVACFQDLTSTVAKILPGRTIASWTRSGECEAAASRKDICMDVAQCHFPDTLQDLHCQSSCTLLDGATPNSRSWDVIDLVGTRYLVLCDLPILTIMDLVLNSTQDSLIPIMIHVLPIIMVAIQPIMGVILPTMVLIYPIMVDILHTTADILISDAVWLPYRQRAYLGLTPTMAVASRTPMTQKNGDTTQVARRITHGKVAFTTVPMGIMIVLLMAAPTTPTPTAQQPASGTDSSVQIAVKGDIDSSDLFQASV